MVTNQLGRQAPTASGLFRGPCPHSPALCPQPLQVKKIIQFLVKKDFTRKLCIHWKCSKTIYLGHVKNLQTCVMY